MGNNIILTNWTEAFERALSRPQSQIHAEMHRLLDLYLDELCSVYNGSFTAEEAFTMEERLSYSEHFYTQLRAFEAKTRDLTSPRKDCQACLCMPEYWED
jgi:hypothetical protein